MKESNVKFEFDNYEIIADAEVWSPADIREIKLDFVGLTKKEVKLLDKDTIKIAKELAKELLVSEVYESEINFND
jgi:hypothetical protein